MRSDSPRLRVAIVGVLAVSLFATLFARLWYLQVLASSEYELQATANQSRTVIEPAPRGRILDRNGVVLVDNRLSFVASLDREVLRSLDEEERTDLFQRVVEAVAPTDPEISVEVIEDRLDSDKYSQYRPVPVAEDIPEDLAVYFREHAAEYDNALQVESKAIRIYPYGQLAAHLLGYVGPINETEMEELEDSPLQYQLSDEIGKGGVEQSMESDLRGQPGVRVLEVDSNHNTVRELPGTTDAVAGHDVYLSLDIRMQAVAEEALKEELDRARGRRMNDGTLQLAPAGSVVVLDPNDGGVLAMASYPTFRPADLTDGIDPDEWDALTKDENGHFPLINRVIAGDYAPGSTFKLVTAVAGLETAMITPETVKEDGGVFIIPNCTAGDCDRTNAGRVAHGRVDLQRAMTVSSDVYFYDLGAELWNSGGSFKNAIQDAAHEFGFGSRTGIPLPGERPGWIPTPENRQEQFEEHPDLFLTGDWYTGDNVNISVGQGDVIATPLQLANAYAALANGGTLMQPAIAEHVNAANSTEVLRAIEPVARETLRLQPGWRESLMAGFVGVTQDGEGTAVGTFAGFPNWVVAGKTGTAQVSGRADTSVFVGMAPAEAPQYVAAAILEESGFGGAAAAPLIRRIFESIADPELTPTVESDSGPDADKNGPGYTLSIPLPEQVNALTSGDNGD